MFPLLLRLKRGRSVCIPLHLCGVAKTLVWHSFHCYSYTHPPCYHSTQVLVVVLPPSRCIIPGVGCLHRGLEHSRLWVFFNSIFRIHVFFIKFFIALVVVR